MFSYPLTLASLALLMLAGREMFPGSMTPHWAGFAAALLLSVPGILSLGFVIASFVPTARLAQPIGAAVLSGLFFPIGALPPGLGLVAWALPTAHGVALMQGIWDGGSWTAHWGNVAGLVAIFVVCAAVAARVFRWE